MKAPAITVTNWPKLEQFKIRRMHPTFTVDLQAMAGAERYLLDIYDSANRHFTLESALPEFRFEQIWDRLAPGHIRFNSYFIIDGQKHNYERISSFNKAAGFREDRVPAPKFPLAEAIRKHYAFITDARPVGQYDPLLPPFIWHCVIRAESGKLNAKAYPGLHYPFHLWSFLGYSEWSESQSEESLRYAKIVADKALEFVTPDDWAWPGFPYSTISQGAMGGDRETSGIIQPLKGAQLGSAMYDYSRATGCVKSLAYAKHIADVLALRQRDDGSLPFRVQAQDDQAEDNAEGSTCLIFALELWDRLNEENGGKYTAAMDKALGWLRLGPLTDYRWIGNYEDIATNRTDATSENYNMYDASRTAMYLLRHFSDDPNWVKKAEDILVWIEDNFVFFECEQPLDYMSFVCPAVVEQANHYYPIDFHLAHYAVLLADLYKATGKREYKLKAIASARALTYYITDDGKPLTLAPDTHAGYGFNSNIWYGCAAMAFVALLRIERLEREADSE
jgi:hypothetical protein